MAVLSGGAATGAAVSVVSIFAPRSDTNPYRAATSEKAVSQIAKDLELGNLRISAKVMYNPHTYTVIHLHPPTACAASFLVIEQCRATCGLWAHFLLKLVGWYPINLFDFRAGGMDWI